MKGTIYLPPNTTFHPVGTFVIAISTTPGIMVFDTRYVQLEMEPEVPPKPTPTPTPETERYKVVATTRLNVRTKHEIDPGNIVKRLNPGDEFPLEVRAEFDDQDKGILWRKTYPSGYWVAVKQGDNVYAVPVDMSSRAG